MKRNTQSILVVIAVTFLLSFSILPSSFKDGLATVKNVPVLGSFVSWISSPSYHLGLDLRGGVKLVYDLDLAGLSADNVTEEVSNLIEFVRDRRIDQLGVSEPKIYSTLADGQYHMVVELPGFQEDPEKAKARIGGSVLLSFKEQKESFSSEELAEINSRNSEKRNLARDILSRIKDGESFGELAREYTDDFDMKYQLGNYGFLRTNSVELAGISDTVAEIADGEVSDLIETGDRIEIVQKVASDTTPSERARARHILFTTRPTGAALTEEENSEALAFNSEQETLALDVLSQIKEGGDFAALARTYSEDPGSKERGGDLGFFGKGVMVAPFEDAIWSLTDPEQLHDGLVKTDFGYHIVQLLERQSEEPIYNISKIVFNLESSAPGQWAETGLTGKQFETAYVTYDPNGLQPVVNISFDSEGTELFADITKRNINKPVAIFIDDVLISSPVVRTEIREGVAVISGGFDVRGAQSLADNLNMGATPINFTYIGGSDISPSLGAESLAISLRAGLIGYALVALYMIGYYRLPGLISVVALGFYTVITLALYNILNVTLSLAGVAGFILSVGMAVDANILIFERMREELRAGKSLSLSLRLGFERAWSSIRDSNVSSLITCSLLLFFGSGLIRGFAFTLAIGIVVSMFSAITITRLLLLVVSEQDSVKKSRKFFIS